MPGTARGEGALSGIPCPAFLLVPFALCHVEATSADTGWRAAACPSLLPQPQPRVWRGATKAGMLTSVCVVNLGQEAQTWPDWPESKWHDRPLTCSRPPGRSWVAQVSIAAPDLPALWLWLQKPQLQNGANNNAKPSLEDEMAFKSWRGLHKCRAWLDRLGLYQPFLFEGALYLLKFWNHWAWRCGSKCTSRCRDQPARREGEGRQRSCRGSVSQSQAGPGGKGPGCQAKEFGLWPWRCKGGLQEASAEGCPVIGDSKKKINHTAREGLAFGRVWAAARHEGRLPGCGWAPGVPCFLPRGLLPL